MSRDICIYQEFLTEAHRAKIQETAREAGFTPHFFTLKQLSLIHISRINSSTGIFSCSIPLNVNPPRCMAQILLKKQ